LVDLSEEFLGESYRDLRCRHSSKDTAMGCLSVCSIARSGRR
jgi:hypothetical protein